jgi:hypothetical protein
MQESRFIINQIISNHINSTIVVLSKKMRILHTSPNCHNFEDHPAIGLPGHCW